MDTKRAGTVLLLAGVLAVCLPSDVFAKRQQTSSTQRAANRASDAEQEVERLLARIRELEASQTRLNEQIKQLRQDASEPAVVSRPAVVAASESAPASPQQADLLAPAEAQTTSDSTDWLLGGLAVFFCALCVVLLLRTRRADSGFGGSAGPLEPGIFGRTTSGADQNAATASPLASDTAASTSRPVAVPVAPEWDATSPALDLQAVEVFTPEAKIHPHDSTIELADIMLSFGRVNSAAEALSNFVEHNPKEAVTPWLKLLEVYRESGQRAEFDRVAHELNKTFNVWAVDWDNFDDARDPAHGLEEAPHIVERLQELWGTRECQAYLQYLMRDTRDETRRGFSLTAIDDILTLAAILEHDLGPYTGPAEAFTETPPDNSPPTEIDEDDDSPLVSQEIAEVSALSQAPAEEKEDKPTTDA